MKDKIVACLWNDDHYEDSLEEMIHYMIEYEELEKEDIISQVVEFCEEANVYSNKDYCAIQDILYSNLDQYEGEYFEKEVEAILKRVEGVKYYNPVQKYVITEEDYNAYFL